VAHRVFPVDALNLARANPSRRWCSSPSASRPPPANAMSVYQARQQGIDNYSILVSHVLVPPAMEAILSSPQNMVQGFLAGGHVCTVMGFTEYEPSRRPLSRPIVVTGFEPVDILQGVYMCIKAVGGRPGGGREPVTRGWSKREGNRSAQQLISQVFEVVRANGAASAKFPTAAGGCAHPMPATTRRSASTSHRSRGRSSECISGLIMQGVKKPISARLLARVARPSARWARDGFVRGCVCGVLSVSELLTSNFYVNRFLHSPARSRSPITQCADAHGRRRPADQSAHRKMFLPLFNNRLWKRSMMARCFGLNR